MSSIMVLGLVLGFQEWHMAGQESWESRAKFWMTREEIVLYETLDQSQREQFKGYFVARRLDQPETWPATGLELPHFFLPHHYGDVRDALIFSLGQPSQILPGPYHPSQPSAWLYPNHRFEFQPAHKKQVHFTPTAETAWETVKASQIKHPNLRYDFRKLTIGRNRLPTELKWLKTQITGAWRIPEGQGTKWRVTLHIPKSFHQQFQEKPTAKVQTMEMLVFLKRDQDQPRTQIERHLIRHDSRRLDLTNATTITFETTLPPGRFAAEVLVYSGFLSRGLRAETKVTVYPEEIPRIGDPIICEKWASAGIALTNSSDILAGGHYYQPTLSPGRSRSRVLISSQHPNTELWLQRHGQKPQRLNRLSHAGSWAIFDCPPFEKKDRLLALGRSEKSHLIAFSHVGPLPGKRAPQPPSLNQSGASNYLRIEALSFSTPPGLGLLSVNKEAFLASENGQFPWPAIDWGPTATLHLEYADGDAWHFVEYPLRRNQVFQEIQVRPKYLVAGVRDTLGQPKQVPFDIEIEGIRIPPEKLTALKQIPKLWGIVVNDALLKSPTWHHIKNILQAWLRSNTGSQDFIYIVHIAARPQLVLAPTRFKPTVLAKLRSLRSNVQLENYFTVRYLFEGLTQLPQHQAMPHQVLLLTHQLTEEVSQMETLLPMLRNTGLQLYNLEFPFEFQPESQARIGRTEAEPLLDMKVKEEDDQWRYGPLRDNLQEQRNVTAGLKFVFRTKGQKRNAKEDAIRLEAFHRAFNQQLAFLTAGMALQSGSNETGISLFLERLTAWQDHLVHVRLPLPFVSADMIQVKPGDGYSAAWTLVEWQPEKSR